MKEMQDDELNALLSAQRVSAPDDLVDRVMAGVPDAPAPSWGDRLRVLWPAQGQWVLPAALGAAAALLLFAGILRLGGGIDADALTVTFRLHAPDAESVALAGSFNNWQPDELILSGPDATGHWSATVELPAGQHEYMFLVDGNEWRSDPTAPFFRPDGFGRNNAVIEVEGV
jgi:hypothetical protein